MAFPSRPWLEPSFELTAHLPEEQRIQISQHRSVKLIALAQLYEHNYITLFGCVNHLLLHSNSGFSFFEQISRFIVSFPYIFFQSPPATGHKWALPRMGVLDHAITGMPASKRLRLSESQPQSQGTEGDDDDGQGNVDPQSEVVGECEGDP